MIIPLASTQQGERQASIQIVGVQANGPAARSGLRDDFILIM